MLFKTIFDRVMAFLGLVFLSPLLLVIALLIRVKSPGAPAIYTQQRVGQHGKLFTMYKFCTMTPGRGGSPISVKGESRITPFGSLLRKYKFDELPELWNVIKGDMSFVGPRPDVPGYADKLEGEDRLILSVKPGITGPASLKYANEEELLSHQDDPIAYNDRILFPDKVRINLQYVKHWSFFLDMKIILFTLFGKKLKDKRFS